ncbi:MAG: 16S rRNA (cytosine(967)-C(5))-methyltransferase RsmB, partial [Bacteroidaceae bacterium]|nr:16S rRNA (cytosine(967)-C(5))-methyltransferase RsmB [Bacteroidaceae bacterium]
QVLDKYAYFEKNERAFLTRLVNGTVERRIELDYIIMLYSKTPIKKMKPMIRTLLRMGTYEIYYMDAIRPAATCDEYVKLTKKRGFQGLSGFLNGVLRNVARGSEKPLEYPDLSVKYSMPEWIIEKWGQDYGTQKAEEICKNLLEPQKGLPVRINRAVIEPEELKRLLETENISCELDTEINEAAYLSDFDSVGNIKAFNEGLFYVQDYSSMQVVHFAEIKSGINILDVCAAPGGKALHAAECLKGTGKVTARDLTEKKVSIIRENIQKSGLKNIEAQVWDATVKDEAAVNCYDLVMADVPCSGLGIIRKKPDIKYHESLEQTEELVKLQAQILDTVSNYVKKGGTLMYSTCTINKQENELQMASFVKAHPEFEIVFDRQLFPSEKQDGFYLCKLVRK